MHWIAPSEKNADNAALEKRLWDAADPLRANSELKSQEYFQASQALAPREVILSSRLIANQTNPSDSTDPNNRP